MQATRLAGDTAMAFSVGRLAELEDRLVHRLGVFHELIAAGRFVDAQLALGDARAIATELLELTAPATTAT